MDEIFRQKPRQEDASYRDCISSYQKFLELDGNAYSRKKKKRPVR